MNEESVIEIIDIILNKGVIDFCVHLPEKAEEGDVYIQNYKQLFIYYNDKWNKFNQKDKDGMIIWINSEESVYTYNEVRNKWVKKLINLF